jgi:hypothetical protein
MPVRLLIIYAHTFEWTFPNLSQMLYVLHNNIHKLYTNSAYQDQGTYSRNSLIWVYTGTVATGHSRKLNVTFREGQVCGSTFFQCIEMK